MSTSFATNAIVAVGGGFVVVASQAFASSTTGWIAFGIAIGTLALACLAQADRSQSVVQRSLDGMVAVVSGWTIVASAVFEGSAVRWLSTAEGIALVALALAGLTYHDVREHAVVHAATDTSTGEALRAAA
jgi:hypothetical protein